MVRFPTARGEVQATASTGGGTSAAFALVDPGYYLARLESAEQKTYNAKHKGVKGEVEYLKVTPAIVLMNEAKTQINRQDVIFGTLDSDGFFYRPDGDKTKPALWAGAGFFLSAVGFIDENGLVDLGGFHTSLISGQYVTVKVGHENYTDKEGVSKTKNVISNFYAPRAAQVEEHGLFFDEVTGMVFSDERAAADWAELRDETLAALDDDGDTPF